MLFELFNSIGPVSSIRVCRDAVTRRSLGYAYVNYHNPMDGEKAMDALNYTIIKDRPCRIMWSQRDPSLRRQGTGNVFIKNLDKAIDSKALYDTFSAFGAILSCKVANDENGSKGYGFVHFDTMYSAEKAIKAVNGMLLNDKKVFVGLHVPRRERESKAEEFKKNFTNVFVKNLPDSVDSEKFEEMFAKFGSITSCALSKDEDGKSKCFGFVNYEDHESADKAVLELHDKEMEGKILFVGRAQKRNEREDELRKKFDQMRLERMNKYQGVNLYVKNLDETISDERLRQEFGVYGTITSARVMVDEKGVSRGFAFVCFSAPEEATKAVTEMNGKLVGSKPIYVALAQRREDRKAMLEAQYNVRHQFRQQAAMGMGFPMPYGGPMGYPPNQMPPQQYMYPQQMGMRPAMNYPGMGQVQQPFGPQGVAGRLPRQPNHPQQGQRGGPGPRSMMPSRPMQGVPNGPAGPAMMYAQQGMPMPLGAQARPPYQNIRAMPQQQQQQQPQAVAAAPRTMALNAATLAKMDPAQQRQLLGERLYPLVQAHDVVQVKYKDMAGKLTGMLLEMETSELLQLLENPESLHGKINEAVTVLEQFLEQQQQAQE